MCVYKFNNDGLNIFVSTTDIGSFKTDAATKLPPAESFKRLHEKTGVPLDRIVRPNLANDCYHKKVNLADGGRGVLTSKEIIKDIDGLITTDVGLYLAITTADCYPIVLHDFRKNILALAHGGWRGVVGRLEVSLLKRMLTLGARLEDISVTYVAGICDKCYVQHDQYLYDVFINKYRYPSNIVGKKGDFYTVDIAAASQHNLRQAGYRGSFNNLNLCNFCDEKLFSVRRDGRNTGRIITLVGMDQ
ncbi:polyphenol oxidase family protein [Proteinivorax hydrogeniformans]|uniref:Polyphenol oxidase family protein n=1 Tax=Proteinivorax hydrogeniformans TaxID=1826727 RepID=A0AAU8HSY8_9FIRM